MGGLLMAFCRPNVGSWTGDGLPLPVGYWSASLRQALRHTLLIISARECR